jgi:radical SAM protein with 4Fe4S-binding SPASM domain
MNIKEMPSRIRAVAGIIHGSRALGGPVQANLLLTNRCNISCIHCYFNSPYLEMPLFDPVIKAKRTGQELPTRDMVQNIMKKEADPLHLRSVVGELLKLGTRRWQIGGKGEPFLYKGAMELIDILKRSGSHCLANTNGTLINADMADHLIRVKFDELRITTMAGTPEVYVRTHPGSTEKTFYQLKETLLYMADKKSAMQVKKPEVTLVIIVINQNYDSLNEFAEFADHVKADRVLFRPVDDIGDPGLAKTVPTMEQAFFVREQLKKVKSFLETRGIAHNVDYFLKIFREKLNTEELHKHIPCYYGWLSSFIGPDGDVYPCCRCHESLGNAYEKGFNEVWNGKSYQQFRKEALQIHRSKKPVRGCGCYSCVHHTANLKVYKALHPLKRFSGHLKSLSPAIE